ncbi:MAG: NAD(P)/FAD-dependent oxidoreductase [Micrococcales bacterium]|nr:NAD(P)/FAD-dependent oxidoreductase [Micrococcales bacterium]
MIGAGQAGLSAAGHLLRKGLQPWRDLVVLDGNDGPGGAWRHRWDSLTFEAAHGIHDLPGFPLGDPDPTEPASRVVSRYYGAYEGELGLPVVRPAAATSVVRETDGLFRVTASDGSVRRAHAVISATGTWNRPHWPVYPGMREFAGRQLHTRDFTSAEEFAGQRVLVVGGGTSALQFLLQLEAAGAHTVWSTRREPDWTDRFFDKSWGADVEASVSSRTTTGLPPLSVVAATGLPLTEQYRHGIEDGTLISRGPLLRLTQTGAVLDGPRPDGRGLPSQGTIVDALLDQSERPAAALPGHPSEADGSSAWETPVDAVLWATGFRAVLDHLAPLRLRQPGGGVRMEEDGVSVAGEPGLFLVGYGASASTIGATRAGRAAALGAVRSTESLTRP